MSCPHDRLNTKHATRRRLKQQHDHCCRDTTAESPGPPEEEHSDLGKTLARVLEQIGEAVLTTPDETTHQHHPRR